MIISHRKKFVFIHIYKVAGTSVRSALAPYADVTFRKYTAHRMLYVLGLAPAPGDHHKAIDIRAKLGGKTFDSYYSFAFVRNPWDWQVSLYHYICSHPLHPQHRTIKKLENFNDYISWRIDNGVELQKSFVTDLDGRVILDFVGHYENLSSDFAKACQALGIESTLPHKNISKHQDYKQYYNDRTAQKIADHYKEDIELFGYSFEP